MSKKNAEKTKARALQTEFQIVALDQGVDAPSYQTCLNAIREHGFEGAKPALAEQMKRRSGR